MKKLQYSIVLASCLLTSLSQAQEFKTSVSEFQVDNKATVTIEASYAEIEIEEWNKNRVEIQGIMNVQGMSEPEAKNIFDAWNIEAEKRGNEVNIRANSTAFGNEYFFIHNDKYLGNVVIDIPDVSMHVIEALDSIHFVLPEIAEFPDIDYDFDVNTNLDYESLSFDYEEFKKNSEYLKEWQERNKDQLQRLKEELKESHAQMAEEHKEMQKQIIVIQEHARETEKHAKEAEEQARKIEKQEQERQYEIQKILEKRQKIKVKRILKVKVPKDAKLEMDVDYCKITTTN